MPQETDIGRHKIVSTRPPSVRFMARNRLIGNNDDIHGTTTERTQRRLLDRCVRYRGVTGSRSGRQIRLSHRLPARIRTGVADAGGRTPIKAQAGAMVSMAGNVELASKMEGGVWGAVTQSVGGRSAFVSTDSAHGRRASRLRRRGHRATSRRWDRPMRRTTPGVVLPCERRGAPIKPPQRPATRSRRTSPSVRDARRSNAVASASVPVYVDGGLNWIVGAIGCRSLIASKSVGIMSM